MLDTSNCYTEILQKIGYKSYSNINYSKLKQLILDFELDETQFKENNKLLRCTNEIGNKYGRLTVKRRAENSKSNQVQWYCDCDCGEKDIIVRGTSLRSGETKSCGCLARETAYLLKKKYNKYDLESKEYGVGWTNNGEEFWFDKEDYDKIKNYCWSMSDGYIVSIDGIKMHRLIMNCPDDLEVDHIRHNDDGSCAGFDNRKINLRLTTHQENMMNKTKYKSNTSGIRGVCWKKDANKWCVRIQKNGIRIHVGYFNTLEEADKARIEAENKYFGEYKYKEEIS